MSKNAGFYAFLANVFCRKAKRFPYTSKNAGFYAFLILLPNLLMP